MGTYRASFTSLKNVRYELDIFAPWLVDRTLDLDADAVHLVVPEAETKYPGLRTTECEINVLIADPMTELFSEGMMAVTVHLHHNGVTDFVGFLETSEWDMPCTPGRLEAKQLVAVDALSAYLQKPCYERTFRSMNSIMDDILADMNSKLPVTVTESGSLFGMEYDAYVDIDSQQPVDLYTKEDLDAAWTSWGDLVNNFAKGTGSTIMMVGDKIKAYYVNDDTGVWCTEDAPAEERLTNTSMTLKMVNSVRRVEQDVTTRPNLCDPEAVDSKSCLVTVMAGHDRPIYDYFGKAAAYYYTNGLEKHWTEGPGWPSGLDSRCHAICGVSFADNIGSLDTSTPAEWMVGVNAVSAPVHVYPVLNSIGSVMIAIKADVHTNTHDREEQMNSSWSGAPCTWDATLTEALDEPMYSTIALNVGGVIVLPYLIMPVLEDVVHTAHRVGSTDYEYGTYDEEAPAWEKLVYYFSLTNEMLLNAEHSVKVVVRSPRRGNVFCKRYVGYSFAKSIRFVGHGYESDPCMESEGAEDKTLSEVASGKDFGSVMKFDCPMNNEMNYSGYIDFAAVILKHPECFWRPWPDPLEQLAAQYREPHAQWQATVDDDGFEPTKKAWCRGSLCTQMASNWNLRLGKVTVSLLN